MTSMSAPIDVSAWVGSYPFRDIPHPDPEVLVRVLDREGFGGAWVGHLPSTFFRDPGPGNEKLYRTLEPFGGVLAPVPIVRPDWPQWEKALRTAVGEGAPAVRVCLPQWGMEATHPALAELAHACGETGVALHLTVRFEDLRQRHPLDAGDLPAAGIRALARLPRSRCRLVVAGAGRDLIEEIHWGLKPDEQSRVWYDWHWLWGPPEEHFAHLLRSVGAERLAWSTWWPLRLAQQARSLVDLLPDDLRNCDLKLADGRSVAAHAQRR